MESILVFPVGSTKACQYCCRFLTNAGISLIDHPSPEVTHLLLDVPSFQENGQLRGGGFVEDILPMLPHSITILGGNLNHSALAGYQKRDLLQDPCYLAENAAITADCALGVAGKELPVIFSGCRVLVIGWGRIGKCLARLLKALDCKVSIAARSAADLAMIQALGYEALHTGQLSAAPAKFRVVYNTVPAPVVSTASPIGADDCVWVDLASKEGILGDGAVCARGLPGIHAPESSGALMAKTILQFIGRE